MNEKLREESELTEPFPSIVMASGLLSIAGSLLT